MKKRIRKTGEIVDVIAWYNIMGAERDKDDSVSYIDSKGNECVKMRGLNLEWDFEDVEEVLSTDIDWRQVRIKAAISVLQGLYSNTQTYNIDDDELAEWSIGIADALIAELKKGSEK